MKVTIGEVIMREGEEVRTKGAWIIQTVNLRPLGFLPEHVPHAPMCTTTVDLDPIGIRHRRDLVVGKTHRHPPLGLHQGHLHITKSTTREMMRQYRLGITMVLELDRIVNLMISLQLEV